MRGFEFDFGGNPFHLLQADFNSSPSDLDELVEVAVRDGTLSAEVAATKKNGLLSQDSRLVHELTWLPQLDRQKKELALQAIPTGKARYVSHAVHSFPNLAQANIIAHFCSMHSPTQPLIEQLTQCWKKFDQQAKLELKEALNRDRQHVGIAEIEETQLNSILQTLLEMHTTALATAIFRAKRPRKLMEDSLPESLVDCDQFTLCLLDKIEKFSAIELGDLCEKIKESSEAVFDESGQFDKNVQQVIGHLVRLKDRSTPYRYERENESRDLIGSVQRLIFLMVKDLYSRISVELKDYASAFRVCKALYLALPKFDKLREISERDAFALKRAIKETSQLTLLEPLKKACQNALTDVSAFEAGLREFGLTTSAPPPVAEVAFAFREAVARRDNVMHAIFTLKDLSSIIENAQEGVYPGTTIRLNDAMLKFENVMDCKETTELLIKESTVLHLRWQSNEMTRSFREGNYEEVSQIVDDMLLRAKGSNYRKLHVIKNNVHHIQREKRVKWFVAAAMALALVYIVIVILTDLGDNLPSIALGFELELLSLNLQLT